jgi:hypothetical protein
LKWRLLNEEVYGKGNHKGNLAVEAKTQVKATSHLGELAKWHARA